MDEDTEIWFQALAGRTTADDRREPALEARALRERLLRMPQTDAAVESSADADREAALLQRARREGLLADRVDRRRGLRLERLLRWPALTALTALACSAVTVAILLHPAHEPEAVRGAPGEPVRLTAADPQQLKSELLAELKSAGVQVTGYERLGREGIDADLPQPPSARVRAILSRHHIEVPPDGVLRIEIAPPAAP